MEDWVKEIIESAQSAKPLSIDEVVKHPDGRTIKIVDGQYYGHRGVSNFWYFREVMPDGSLSEKLEHGYGNEIRQIPKKTFLCDCACHQEGNKIMHIAPCCEKCKLCNQRIKFGCMEGHVKECQPNLIIDEKLVEILSVDTKWHTAFDGVKQEYHNLLLSLVDNKEINSSKFVRDFLTICGSKNKNEFSGRVSLGEIFDEAAIILQVEFKKEDNLKRLEIMYNEVGLVSFAAIA